ncbi:MAG: hypothetical protein QNI89_19815 [Desulfobacterales bacterium]|nr:hypothetical protein [Desulfobacterales bacterium]MDJ0856251.1 hypothetical protein [Desulfobacterales bacterium]MDJ0889554.1 hypothetical protein [Desulfobacterales bacterium]
MKKFLAEHPYVVTSGVFIVLITFGFLFLHWRRDEYAFILLLYFIITLGIRLDDISRQIGIGAESPATLAEKNERVLHLMRQIQQSLDETNARLAEIQTALDRRRAP